ncbi:hypothetical protein GVO57_04595 [Sphingomonas changnyeongensis]|uniref:Invasion protein IalB, involved in pathogenesis n=1 Tax=Sphingomonas changnyeongensis TaxID=2698679 RepID=A0A7Z2NUW3_9SPHN|nr:hypothetical protein [Sphingomonas changnyeongensis]QHL90246.1 hypothetical protein GVO57_04595 [Sphingomonas changnyeongensis]
MIRAAAIRTVLAAAAATGLTPAPAAGREDLGIYGRWGAFRDPAARRCHAIARPVRPAPPAGRAMPDQPYASIGFWPGRQPGGQLHLRLSRAHGGAAGPVLSVGGRRFALIARGVDAWAADQRMDAAIIAALRSAEQMTISGRTAGGVGFADHYALRGAASAIDAAMIGCAVRR